MNIRLAAGTSLTSVEGRDVLFSVRSGESYGLNETAAQMAAEYGVGAEEIRGDIEQLVQELIQLRMVEALPDHGA